LTQLVSGRQEEREAEVALQRLRCRQLTHSAWEGGWWGLRGSTRLQECECICWGITLKRAGSEADHPNLGEWDKGQAQSSQRYVPCPSLWSPRSAFWDLGTHGAKGLQEKRRTALPSQQVRMWS
jgi:hypothetical protein